MSWTPLHDFRKNQAEEWLFVAWVIIFGSSHTDGPGLGPPQSTQRVEGYLHGNENILIVSFKKWLPTNHSDIPEFLEISFEAILPRRNQDSQQCTKHPSIPKFLTKDNDDGVGHQQTASSRFCCSSSSEEADVLNLKGIKHSQANAGLGWGTLVGWLAK